jgi:hypothetical protein
VTRSTYPCNCSGGERRVVAGDRIWSPEIGRKGFSNARQESGFGRSDGNSGTMGGRGLSGGPGARSHYAAYQLQQMTSGTTSRTK